MVGCTDSRSEATGVAATKVQDAPGPSWDASPNLLEFTPRKPKWMRWRTYERLATLDEAIEMERDAVLMRRMVRIAGRL